MKTITLDRQGVKQKQYLTAVKLQRHELTEYKVFAGLARLPGQNKGLLLELAKDKKRHYQYFRKITGTHTKPNYFKAWIFLALGRTLGLLFTLRLLLLARQCRAAKNAVHIGKLSKAKKLARDKAGHEKKIISLINDERLDYAGSIVLGLNDALVEITGALAGLTFALQNTRVVAAAGLITGLAASISMAASSFLAAREDPERHKEHKKSPVKSAFYTGAAYITVVLALIAPYLLLENVYMALAASLLVGVLVVALYSFYISTAKDKAYATQFFTMLSVFLMTAILSFGFGLLVKAWLSI